jgi:ribonuclease HI
VKLNVDGAFGCDGAAGTGMVLRDHEGHVIFAACRQLRRCRDATEAELEAMEEGLKLALLWTCEAIVLESDCSVALDLIRVGSANNSVYAFKVSSIRELVQERGILCAKIGRETNSVAHGLAQLGRINGRTDVWLRDYPPDIHEAITNDCNSTLVK